MPDTIPPNKPTAVIPFAKFSIDTELSSTATTAKAAMPTAIAVNDKAILGALLPAKRTAETSPETIAESPIIPTAALPISSHDIPAINLDIHANIAIAVAMPKRVNPILGALLPAKRTILIRPPTMIVRPVRPAAALPIPSHVIVASILATTPKMKNAPATAKSVVLIVLAFALRLPLVNKAQAAITSTIVKAIVFKPNNPINACSGFIFPIFLTTEANIQNTIDMDKSALLI